MLKRYLGKIRAIFGQEGFFYGLKKIIKVFFSMLHPAGSGDVLFISSGIVGDSSRYRVLNVAEELSLHGLKCSSVVQEHPMLMSCADKFNIFVFHKVSYIPQIQKFIKKLKKENKEIIFETDDLLFDPGYIKQQDFFKNANEFEKKFFENGIGGEILRDPYVKVCTTSTVFLAEKIKEYGKKVFVVSNKLSEKDIEIAAGILEAKKLTKLKANEAVRIGYFSGTSSHNKDFATITGPLIQIMEKYENVELFLAGPLDIENGLNKFSSRTIRLSFVPREKHFANIANVDINLAPLEIGNPFCEARSELKFFEAGIMKIPTIAAATQTFREAIKDGIDGFVASGEKEWFEKIERLVIDENLRKEIGERACKKAIEKYSIKNSNNEEYYSYLKNKNKSYK
ncbi:MAG TPA: glycosyltransferase [Candidatus Moranbacteria bacterium]|nr:glycosyltransferase [Candidatus Moranbacteria bacterium]HRZ33722.1 glycosyltransferase [Candidatus Moranbacteria bacterium]